VLPSYDDEVVTIRQAYGDTAETVIAAQLPFLKITPEQFETLKQKIVGCWDDILVIADSLPTSDEIRAMLATVGGPTTREELRLSEEEIHHGLMWGHYLRNRFTVLKLSRILGVSSLPGQM
jgi:glycerol dehydrogenase-like iron-containing ADH family enzyme